MAWTVPRMPQGIGKDCRPCWGKRLLGMPENCSSKILYYRGRPVLDYLLICLGSSYWSYRYTWGILQDGLDTVPPSPLVGGV